MAYDGKTMSVREMQEEGLLQEVNRRFFHPLGLALEVIMDSETGEMRIERLWDSRDDPEGWYFEPGVIDVEKAKAVDAELERRAPARIKALGYVIQPAREVIPDVAVNELGVGARFSYLSAMWRISARGDDWLEARNEQFSNIVSFKATPEGDQPPWTARVVPLTSREPRFAPDAPPEG